MGKFKKTLFSTSITIGLLYIGVCIYFYNIQNAILFKPHLLETGHTYNYPFDFEERYFQIGDEARIHAIHAKVPDSSKGLVIYYHGNAGNNDTDVTKFELFMNEGYDVIYPDYRGFGQSTGDLEDEDDLVGDMKVVYSEMKKEYDEENIFIVGYSMGSGVAALVAAENDPKGVMIWTPYYSMVDMKNASYPFLPTFLVRYPLRTDLALPKIDEPITIFYAGEDEVLPIDRSIHLKDKLKETDQYFIIENQGHNGIYRNAELSTKVPEILARK
ncbi:MAG: alpha/beta fold hydrolase [Balneolaceae bacterium]